jgi:hypothetical protein
MSPILFLRGDLEATEDVPYPSPAGVPEATERLLQTSPILSFVVTLRLSKSLLFFSLVVVLMMLRDSQSITEVKNRILDVRQSRTQQSVGYPYLQKKNSFVSLQNDIT